MLTWRLKTLWWFSKPEITDIGSYSVQLFEDVDGSGFLNHSVETFIKSLKIAGDKRLHCLTPLPSAMGPVIGQHIKLYVVQHETLFSDNGLNAPSNTPWVWWSLRCNKWKHLFYFTACPRSGMARAGGGRAMPTYPMWYASLTVLKYKSVKSVIKSLKFVINNAFRKIFATKSCDIANCYRHYTGIKRIAPNST